MLAWCCDDADQTRALGAALGRAARAGDALALHGGLGAGKTTFTQGLAAGLGISGPIPSPTYAIVHVHPGPTPLWHADLYRVDAAEDLAPLALEEAADAGAVLVVEWAERFPQALPADHLAAQLEPTLQGGRQLRFTAHGPAAEAWLGRLTHGR